MVGPWDGQSAEGVCGSLSWDSEFGRVERSGRWWMGGSTVRVVTNGRVGGPCPSTCVCLVCRKGGREYTSGTSTRSRGRHGVRVDQGVGRRCVSVVRECGQRTRFEGVRVLDTCGDVVCTSQCGRVWEWRVYPWGLRCGCGSLSVWSVGWLRGLLSVAGLSTDGGIPSPTSLSLPLTVYPVTTHLFGKSTGVPESSQVSRVRPEVPGVRDRRCTCATATRRGTPPRTLSAIGDEGLRPESRPGTRRPRWCTTYGSGPHSSTGSSPRSRSRSVGPRR